MEELRAFPQPVEVVLAVELSAEPHLGWICGVHVACRSKTLGQGLPAGVVYVVTVWQPTVSISVLVVKIYTLTKHLALTRP